MNEPEGCDGANEQEDGDTQPAPRRELVVCRVSKKKRPGEPACGFRSQASLRRHGRDQFSRGEALASYSLDGEELFEQRFEELDVEGVGAIGFGVGGRIVHFNEEAVNAGGNSGAREERNVFGLAAADAVGRGRLLHRVGGIEDDRRETAHDGQRAKVDDQVVVAER